MTTVQEIHNKIKITIPKRHDLILSNVYNRDFFSAFDLKDFHIEHVGIDEPIVPIKMDETGSIVTIVSQDKEGGPDLADELLGPETIPNGYSDLPLDKNMIKPNNTTLDDDRTLDEDEVDDDDDLDDNRPKQTGGIGFLENLQYYAHKYMIKPIRDKMYGQSSNNDNAIETNKGDELTDPGIPNRDIVIVFPRKHNSIVDYSTTTSSISAYNSGSTQADTLDKFQKMTKDDLPSIYHFPHTGIDYLTLEHILKDLLIQFVFFNQEDVVITQIRREFIYEIQGRYILLDGESIEKLSDDETTMKEQMTVSNKAILQLVYDLLDKKDRDVVVGLAEIRGTSIYQMLYRLETDNILEWV